MIKSTAILSTLFWVVIQKKICLTFILRSFLGGAEEGVGVGVGDVVGAADGIPLVPVHGHSADVV